MTDEDEIEAAFADMFRGWPVPGELQQMSIFLKEFLGSVSQQRSSAEAHV